MKINLDFYTNNLEAINQISYEEIPIITSYVNLYYSPEFCNIQQNGIEINWSKYVTNEKENFSPPLIICGFESEIFESEIIKGSFPDLFSNNFSMDLNQSGVFISSNMRDEYSLSNGQNITYGEYQILETLENGNIINYTIGEVK